ncbi:hypothetical protein [Laribacter hongkongensis]|nr:hypothetical protein [Laribacter hongkongensis]MCG9098034.1 hypothetical protein [Laribacter hongkongensis]
MIRQLDEIANTFLAICTIPHNERLASAAHSVGNTGDNYDNAPAETINGLQGGGGHLSREPSKSTVAAKQNPRNA